MSLYQTWKNDRIKKDDQIKNVMIGIASKYNYRLEFGFGMMLQKKESFYHEPKFAEVVEASDNKFAVSTVSSRWSVEEATLMVKQMQEAMALASELNLFIDSLDYQLKKEFETVDI